LKIQEILASKNTPDSFQRPASEAEKIQEMIAQINAKRAQMNTLNK
jgi:hypothetical protein